MGLAIAVLTVGRAAAARPAPVAIAIVAEPSCPRELRQRITEQIADLAEETSWSCLPRLDEEEPFRAAAAGGDGVQFWIDLTPGTEARLTLRDGASDRFVVRRIPLPAGLDEIGREEIGQIVRSALLAVRAGPDDTLTRAEARAEVARWPQRPPPPPPKLPADVRAAPAASSTAPLAIELGAFGSARAFASEIPVVAEIGAGIDVGLWRPLAGWVEAAYQPPARYDASPAGVVLTAVAGRAGLAASRRLGGALRARLGAGAGLTRTAFTPRGDGTAATVAPPGAFWYATGRAFAGLDARLGAHAVVGLAVLLDAVGADVHYDLRELDGTTHQVLAPYRFQPGIALGIAWSRSARDPF